MDMVGHDYEIGGGERGIGGMLAFPHLDDHFASGSERERGIIAEAREYWCPTFDTERDEEEFAAGFAEIQVHEEIL